MAKNLADWDMTPYFSAIDGDDLRAFRAKLGDDLAERGIALANLAPLLEDTAAAWASELVALEELSSRVRHLGSYLSCMGAADASDDRVRRETAHLAGLRAELDKAYVTVRAALGTASEEAFEALCAQPELTPVRYALERLRARAATMMPADLERLAADLGVNGIGAWGRLYDRLTGSLTFELRRPGGERETLPVAMVRTCLEDPDGEVRAAAQRGAAEAFESVSASVAACLNAISGTRLRLCERRGVNHVLEPALFDAGIERATLDALFEAVRARQDVPRRYLIRKAEMLGRERLGFQDLMAPLPVAGDARIPWSAARERVLRAFGDSYPKLGELAERAFEERWIDHSPRPGKRPGAFCSSSAVLGQSRVYMTYGGALGDVQTLAHELGHAFHSHVMRDLRPWARHYPMTLAETASTFAEQLVTDAALADPSADPKLRLVVLERRMQEASTFLLNIPTRFDFEYALYERRAGGELSVDELCELMLVAQRKNYGDALAANQLDPWFWASKLHFYLVDISFYNFPYTFGHLLSRAIVSRAKTEGRAFLPSYERLLRATGSDTAENVISDALGEDLRSPAFWSSAIDLIEADLERFEAAAAGTSGSPP
jgi:oligoendopeptidase F